MAKCKYCGEDLVNIIGQKKKKYCPRPKNCSWKSTYIEKKDYYKQQAREWGKRNPEKVKEMNKRNFDNWRKEHPERFKELMKKQYERNKGKYIARSFSRYYKKQIWDKFDGKCNNCGNKSNLEIHHLDYTIEKAEHRQYKKITNLKLNIHKVELLCHDCHIAEHNKKV